jgi:predicted dehydrogenase
MDQVRLGIVGCGGFVYGFLYDTLKALPARLIAVADPNEEALSRFSARYVVGRTYDDYRRMLDGEELDAVISFPAEDTQFAVARECLSRDLSVLSERPVCREPKQQAELLELEGKSRGYLISRLNKRFIPGYRLAGATIRREDFGRPTMYMAKFQAGPYASQDALLYHHIIHHIDLARFLIGELEVRHVDRIALDSRRVGFNISFVGQSGCIGVLQSGSFQSGVYPQERVEISGEGVLVVVDNLRDVLLYRGANSRETGGSDALDGNADSLAYLPNNAQLANDTRNGYENLVGEFISSVLAGRAPDPSYAATSRAVDLVRTIEGLAR